MDNIWAGLKKNEVDALIKVNKENKPKYDQSGYRFPKDSLSCKFGSHWDEDVAGDGGSRMRMFECVYDGDKEPLECCEENSKCPAYEPIPTYICLQHDIEYADYCPRCHPDSVDWS